MDGIVVRDVKVENHCVRFGKGRAPERGRTGE